MDDTTEIRESVKRLTRDLRDASRHLTTQEARYLVDEYYMMQRNRIRSAHQQRTLAANAEPNILVGWLAEQDGILEAQIKRVLDIYTEDHPLGKWPRSVVGVGPVTCAGLLAHIDFNLAPTVGHIWRFAGLDPTVKWGKGQKRPWNARLKQVCFHLGESFVKFSAREDCFYGQLWRRFKEREIKRNEAGEFAEVAKQTLAERNFGADTVTRAAYEKGRLPDGRIHNRAKRKAVKLFLSHFHQISYPLVTGKPAPKPYPIDILCHAHMIEPPSWA